MSKCDTVAKLRKARDIVKTNWCKGDLQKGDKFCALGALGVRYDGPRDASPRLKLYHYQYDGCEEAIDYVAKQLDRATLRNGPGDGKPSTLVYSWNDDDYTTHQKVIDVFDKALAAAIADVEQEVENDGNV